MLWKPRSCGAENLLGLVFTCPFPVEQNRKGVAYAHSTALLLFTRQPTVMPPAHGGH